MTTELPATAKAHLAAINEKLLQCIRSKARAQTSARSNFMQYGDDVGGPMLESTPEIDHPEGELLDMYQAMFESAKAGGVELREIETLFKKTKEGRWSHETRWISVAEYDAFIKSVEPMVERIRVTLRRLASEIAPTWEWISYKTKDGQPFRVVLSSDSGKQTLQPSKELVQATSDIASTAKQQDLLFTDGSWDVESELDDEEGEIESAIGVI